MKRISIKKFKEFVSSLQYWRIINNGKTLEHFSHLELEQNKFLRKGNSIPRCILKRTERMFRMGHYEPYFLEPRA